MGPKPEQWSFVVPGDSIAMQHPALVKLLAHADKPWEDFIYPATAELLGHLNRQGLSEFQDNVRFLIEEATRQTPQQFHTAQIDEIVVEVIAALDIVADDISSEKHYAILYPAVVSVLQLILRYIPLMFEAPRIRHGIPYEISLDRLVGKDLVFTISYL